ncbi:MAG: hypothetical protein IK138_09745 [Lachnospiraceae bacterium]|nr:hypothetical protein [Lachnospiraceae bacterium]
MRVQHIFTSRVLRFFPRTISPSNRLQEYLKRSEKIVARLQIIKTKPGMKLVSSSFLMDCPDKSLGEDGLLVYADCVVVPNPNAEELANIAVAAADTKRDRVPSFSQGTRSFYHRSVDIILYFQSSHNDI